MEYQPPLNGDTGDDNRSYINGNPATQTTGSIPPAEAIEHPQREIIAVIEAAGLVPDAGDLTQLVQAVQSLGGGGGVVPIGQPFPVWDHIVGVSAPDNSGSAKYICLTAGLTDTGEYNEGLLSNEVISGVFPDNTATADIAVGTLAGQTVALINTEMSFLRPSEASGVYEQDEFKEHVHNFYIGGNTAGGNRHAVQGASYREGSNPGSSPFQNEGGTETRPKNRQATFYMRIV